MVPTGRLTPSFHAKVLTYTDSTFRAWGVRAAGNFGKVDGAIRAKVVSMSADPAPDVRLQVAIASKKIEGVEPIPVLVAVLAHSPEDGTIPHIVWQNLHPLLETDAKAFLAEVRKHDLKNTPALQKIMPRVTERMLAGKKK